MKKTIIECDRCEKTIPTTLVEMAGVLKHGLSEADLCNSCCGIIAQVIKEHQTALRAEKARISRGKLDSLGWGREDHG